MSTTTADADRPLSRRDRVRAATEAEIKDVARRQLVESEGAELSLRGIARDMGMTAPALYRYFDNLGALTEAMCHDYVDELAGVVRAAVEAAGDDLAARMHGAIRAFRGWAVDHPAEFGLLFRSRGPGAVAFPEKVRWADDGCPHAVAFARTFLDLFVRLWAEQPFELPDVSHVPAAALADARRFGEAMRVDLPDEALVVFLHAWVRLYSIVALEVLGQLEFMFTDVEPYFEAELGAVARLVGLAYVPPSATG